MRFEHVEGRYNEENETNEAEAQHIIRVLNQIKKTPQRTFPTVGIACFSVGQRNLILDYLLEIKRKRQQGAEKIQQLERNGLGVFHVDDLVGQHFDILIISGTYGAVDLKGTLSSHIQRLEQPGGTKSLYLLMGRALKEVFIINSLPLDYLESCMEDHAKNGSFLLTNFYAYAQAIQQTDPESQQKIVENVQKWQASGQKAKSNSFFLKEVARSLTPYLKSGRIEEQVSTAHLSFPLLIKPTNEDVPPLVLQPDGFFAQTPATDFFWEHQQWERLNQNGYHYLPIWSARWWKTPLQEARRLASTIIKHDDEEN